jgi:hypothetical protein
MPPSSARVTALALTLAVGACGPKGPAPAASASAAQASASAAASGARAPAVVVPRERPTPGPTAPADGIWSMMELQRAVNAESGKYVGTVVQLRGYFEIPPAERNKNRPVGPLDNFPLITRTASGGGGGGVVCVPAQPPELERGAPVIASGKLSEVESGLRLDDCTLTADPTGTAPAPAPEHSAGD